MDPINEVIAALSKAQGSYKKLICNEWSTGGSYANLQAILDATRHSLSENGLAFYQYIDPIDGGSGGVFLRTVLAHASGQFISSSTRLVTPETDKAIGNSYEIHKRFHALMILGIAPSENDPDAHDDAGDMAAEDHLVRKLRQPGVKIDYNRNATLTSERAREIEIELEGQPDMWREIKTRYGIELIKDLPNDHYILIREEIRRVKSLLEKEALKSKFFKDNGRAL